MNRLPIVLSMILLLSCDPPPPPAPRLPADIEATIARLKGEETGLSAKVSELNSQIDALEQKRLGKAAEVGAARYMLKLQLGQSHWSLSIKEHLKDAMNKVDFWVPVDKEMFESTSVGGELADDFRIGSLVLYGSIGSWKVKILEKKIVEKPTTK